MEASTASDAMKAGLEKFGLENMSVEVFAIEEWEAPWKNTDPHIPWDPTVFDPTLKPRDNSHDKYIPLNDGQPISLVEAILRRGELLQKINWRPLWHMPYEIAKNLPKDTKSDLNHPQANHAVRQAQAIAVFKDGKQIGKIPYRSFTFEAATNVRELILWWLISDVVGQEGELWESNWDVHVERHTYAAKIILESAPWTRTEIEEAKMDSPLHTFFKSIWFGELREACRYFYKSNRQNGHSPQEHLPVAGDLWRIGSRLVGHPHEGFIYAY